MVQYIEKRDGTISPFNINNIVNALRKAGVQGGDLTASDAVLLGNIVKNNLNRKYGTTINIEQIQDEVENILFAQNKPKTLRAYIVYREKRAAQRDLNHNMINVENSIDEYISKADWRVNANANQGYSLGGMILNISGKVTANYWLNKIYPKEVGQAHRNGDIHIHDLDMLAPYCMGWSLKNVLQQGMNGIPGKIESNPPKHLGSALNQAMNHLCCFTGDTKFWKANGEQVSFEDCVNNNITELEVLSFDQKTGKVIKSLMTNIGVIKESSELIELDFGEYGKIKCTPDHRFFTRDCGWVEAKDLTEDHDIINLFQKYFFVYKTVNKITNDVYIGSHVTDDLNDGYLGSSEYLNNQIKEYGCENFERTILEYTDNVHQLRELETSYIKKYQNKFGTKCLNIISHTPGGWENVNTKASYKIVNNFIGQEICKILVHRKNSVFYCWEDRLEFLKSNGYQVADINLVYNDGERNYYNPKNKSELFKGGLRLNYNHPTIGVTMPQSFMDSLAKRNDDPEIRAKINASLRYVDDDGYTPAGRAMNSKEEYKDGLTLAQYIAKKQIDNGTNAFLNSKIQTELNKRANTPEKRRQAKWTLISKYANWLISKYGYITKQDWNNLEIRLEYYNSDNYLVANRLPKFDKVVSEYPEFVNLYTIETIEE